MVTMPFTGNSGGFGDSSAHAAGIVQKHTNTVNMKNSFFISENSPFYHCLKKI